MEKQIMDVRGDNEKEDDMATTTMATTTARTKGPRVVMFAEDLVEERTYTPDPDEWASIEDPSEHFEDWTTTISEKDTWAYQERRKNVLRSKGETYPKIPRSIQINDVPEEERMGSILGLWRASKDKNGNDILISGEGHDETVPEVKTLPMSRRESKDEAYPLRMRAELNDRKGPQIKVESIPARTSTPPLQKSRSRSRSPLPVMPVEDDRRGSILSLWTTGRDSNGNHVLHSGEAHDEESEGEVLSRRAREKKREEEEERRRLKSKEERERQGSILSLWSNGGWEDE